jgi:Na+/proline symporter
MTIMLALLHLHSGGGMFSIVVTDFVQFVVLAIGMLVATVAVLATWIFRNRRCSQQS